MVRAAARIGQVGPGEAGGTRAGTAYYWLGGQLEAVPLRLAGTLPAPSWWWRMVHG